MNIFGTSVGKLQRKSGNIVKVFTDTVTKLTEVNDKILVEKGKKLAKVDKLREEVHTLDSTHTQNTNFINKVTSLFGK